MAEHIKSAEDLAANESFQNWVNRNNPSDMERWESWIAANPHHLDLVEAATSTIKLLQLLRKKEVTHKKKDLIIEYLQKRILSNAPSPVKVVSFRFVWMKSIAAAMAAVLIGAAVYFYFSSQPMSHMKTEYGENKEFHLPDGSEVSLNSNSGLTINKAWNTQSAREVWLDGEAFFSIKHTRSNQRFIVHTDNGDVIVLGTQFNVFNRRGKTQVVLTSGKVKVIARNTSDTIYLHPGQMVELTLGEVKKKNNVDVSRFTAWKRNTLSFEAVPLRDIAILIKDNYGYEIVWSDEQIRDIRFTYELVGNDLDLLLTTLSEALDLDIQKKENLIYIKSK